MEAADIDIAREQVLHLCDIVKSHPREARERRLESGAFSRGLFRSTLEMESLLVG